MTDLILANARIRTMDAARPTARAVAIVDGRIAAFDDEAAAAAPDAERIDLGGRTVMPGLLDVHNHAWLAGVADLFELEFSPALDVDGILAAVAAYAAEHPEGWIVGGSWGSGLFEALQQPGVLARLDEAAGGRPLMLRDDSKHNRLANTAAMRLAGIDAGTADPAGGQILRDADGRPTGVLIEAAGILIEKALQRDAPTSVRDLARGAARGVEMLNGYGITGFQEAATSLQLLEALHLLDGEGALNAHVVTSALANDFIFGADPLGEGITRHRERFRSAHHHPDFIKIFLDGVPPSYTGAFLEPYRPAPGIPACHCGSTTMPYSELEGTVLRAAEEGLGAKIHCTGDASVRAVLDVAAVIRDRGFTTPIQIAHGQFVHRDDIARFAELDVTADVSPSLFYPGIIPDALAAVLPEATMARIQPNRELLDAGARVAWGSDWPVAETPNPWHAVYGLVTREDPTGTVPGALAPAQAITLDEALAAITVDTADAIGLGAVAGRLAAGRPADLVVLSADPAEAEGRALAEIRAEQTWFAGRKVHEA